eukprot:scaffold32340_cov112-Isochrysis_galbana.AAC.2
MGDVGIQLQKLIQQLIEHPFPLPFRYTPPAPVAPPHPAPEAHPATSRPARSSHHVLPPRRVPRAPAPEAVADGAGQPPPPRPGWAPTPPKPAARPAPQRPIPHPAALKRAGPAVGCSAG